MSNRHAQINEQIAEANRVINKFGYTDTAIITASKLKSGAKKEYFGFRFLVNEHYKTGDIIKNNDGSISKIEAIIWIEKA